MNARHLERTELSDSPDSLESQASLDSRHGPGPSITVLRGDPSDAELAAVTAVLTAMVEESADDAMTQSASTQSAWQRSTRALRTPLHPGPGSWRGFSG